MVALNGEIYQLESNKDVSERIIDQKIKQLRRLGIANALLYLSALFFMFAALCEAIHNNLTLFKILMIVAVFLVTVALIFLFIHSIKAIEVRQKHLKN